MRAILMSALMLGLSVLPLVSGVGGNISENTVWTNETVTEDTTIEPGSILTIDENLTFNGTYTITVEQGATLIFNHVNVNGLDQKHLKLNATSTLLIPSENTDGTGTVTIRFHQSIYYSVDMNITVGNDSYEVVNTSEISMNVDLSESTIEANFLFNPFQEIRIVEVVVEPDIGGAEFFAPSDLSGEGTSIVSASDDAQWHVINYGDLSISGSHLFSGSITCYGTCDITDSTLTSSSPVEVMDNGSLDVEGTTFTGSRTWEDVLVHDKGEITWTNNVGTGGDVDHWVRILSSREVLVSNSNIIIDSQGIGYYGKANAGDRVDCKGSPVPVCDGIVDLAGLGFEGRTNRMVEWVNGDGVYGIEQATIYAYMDTIWGNFSQIISPVPHENQITVDIPLPLVEITAIEPAEKESVIDTSLGVQIKLVNTGIADANVRIQCFVGDEDAYILPSTPTVMVPAGEEAMVPVNWRMAVEGESVLSCSLIIPTEYEGTTTLGTTDLVSASQVEWEPREEGTPNLFFPILIALIIGIAVAAIVARNRS